MSPEEFSLASADFDKPADVRTIESLHGNIHLGICQGPYDAIELADDLSFLIAAKKAGQ